MANGYEAARNDAMASETCCSEDACGNIDVGFWFKGFLDGMAVLDEPQRERLFRSCARTCLAQGTMAMYGELFEQARGDLDEFFGLVRDIPGVSARIERPGHAWCLIFETCSCPLHGAGYVDDPALCGCSRQSVTLAMHELWPDERFTVRLVQTVLRGDPVCELAIDLLT